MDISEVEDTNLEVQHGPETIQDRDNRMSNELKSKFDTLNRAGQESELYSEHLQQQRVITDVSALLYCHYIATFWKQMST